MHSLVILRKVLHDERWPALLCGVVLAAVAVMDVLIWPTYRDSLKDFQLPGAFEGLVGEAGSISTPEGFLAAEFFSWIGLVIITLAIVAGTNAVAGEEGAGTLEFLLALPIRRRRYLLERTGGLAIALTVATLLGWAGFAIAVPFADMPVSSWRFFQAVVFTLPLTFLFLALSIAASAALPSRSAAATFCTGVVILCFFANMIGGAVPDLSWLERASPFYWSDGGRILLHGFDWVRAGVMLAAAAVILLFGLVAFERRDIGAGPSYGFLRRLLRRHRYTEQVAAPDRPAVA